MKLGWSLIVIILIGSISLSAAQGLIGSATFDSERGVMTFAPVLKQALLSVVTISGHGRRSLRRPSLFYDPDFRHFFENFPQLLDHGDILTIGSGVIINTQDRPNVCSH